MCVGIQTNPSGAGGRMVYLDHDDGKGSDFLHLSSVVARVNTWYRAGSLIGYSGASGYGSDHYYGPHLHISIRDRHGYHTMNAGNFDFDAWMKAAGGGGKGADAMILLYGPSPSDGKTPIFAVA